MDDGTPKDYSSVYSEETKPPPVPPIRKTLPQKQTFRTDGYTPKVKSESTIDLRAVVAKLQKLPIKPYAMDTLNKHYSSVFMDRTAYKAYIKYFDEKDTYVVRVENNTLKALKEKLPKRGQYRYFFKQSDNTYEEIEVGDQSIPYHEKDGSRRFYCQVFPF